jgi:protein-tyrosine-phosphatase
MDKVVLFVCTGNSCRSPMAAGLLKKLVGNRPDVKIISAGVSAFPDMTASDNAIEVMKQEGVDISQHRTQRLTPEIIKEATLILAMTKLHRVNVLELDPEARGKVFLLKEFDQNVDESFLDIPDPIGQPIDDYQRCLAKMKSPIQYLVKNILKDDTKSKGEEKK